jgi:hypothetical protein
MHICHICNTEVEDHEVCPKCVIDVPLWKSPEIMTVEERVAEMYLWYNPAILEVPFDMMVDRICGLVGRNNIHTHELLDYDGLVNEIRGSKEPPTVEQICESLVKLMGDPDKVILFDPDGSLTDHAKK